MIVYIIRLYWL